MATTKNRAATGNGHAVMTSGGLDRRLMLEQTESLMASASAIARIAEETGNGAESQIRSLDDAVRDIDGLTSSLKETATKSDGVTASTEELVSGVNEMAAS